jgi:hypothetical protein
MPLVNVHAVVTHVVLHFVDNFLSSCFNAEHLPSLHNVVSLSLSEVNSWG